MLTVTTNGLRVKQQKSFNKISIMKKATIIIAIAAAAILTGCKSIDSAFEARRGEISWNAFCAARGYDRNDNTDITINEYLDTWCGSADEETALIQAGVKPY